MCISRFALLLPLTLLPLSASAEWLEFGAGCPVGSEPLAFHNITLDDLISFDVELQGLLADTIVHESIPYLRFDRSPGTTPMDFVGYPELPTVVCFVAVPDESDLELTYSAACMESMECLPVYPAPLDSMVGDSTGTLYITEFFMKDSAAYASEEWYPEGLAEVVGEFHLRDQRVAIVSVHPVQYLASGDSLRVWSDIELSISFTGQDPEWSQAGLGYYDLLVGDMLLGYRPDYEPIDAPSPRVVRHEDTTVEPSINPDYVIIAADGLDGQWIDDFADYRSDLNRFDVLIANLEDIMDGWGNNSSFPTPDIIRDYTEALWAWSPAGERPTYLLLIGDHEDVTNQAYPGWFLPAHLFEASGSDILSANDSWYAYFDEPRITDVSPPDMIVGRLSVRRVDGLEAMLDLIEEYESPVQTPGPSARRHLVRLSGRDDMDGPIYSDDWIPTMEWTEALKNWLGYTWDNFYCGDGDPYTSDDGSTMSSRQWIAASSDVFENGSQVLFYTDHGSIHFFECGLNDSPTPEGWYGQCDSTFDDLEIRALSPGGQDFCHPFVLLFSCSQNTFNWTEWQQYHIWPHWNYYNDEPGYTHYDFGVDCFAEELMKNTDCGAIGVYGASWGAWVGHWGTKYAILDNIFSLGHTRIGDAVVEARLTHMGEYLNGIGSMNWDYGVYNLLGDPAVDIGDRVKFPTCCDLILSPSDLSMNRYPSISVNGGNSLATVQVRVRNAGAVASGSFDVGLRIVLDAHVWRTSTTCEQGLAPGEEVVLQLPWSDPPEVAMNAEFLFIAEVDHDEECPDSWRGNNRAEARVSIVDFYPNDVGWPVQLPGSLKSPPLLAQLDHDDDLEIVAISGNMISAWDSDHPSAPLWMSGPFEVNEDWWTWGGSQVVANGFTIPVAGDLTGDGIDEIIVDTYDELIVLEANYGTVLDSWAHDEWGNGSLGYPHPVLQADIYPDSHEDSKLEIAVQWLDHLNILDFENGELVLLDSEEIPCASSSGVVFGWQAARDLDQDGYTEIVHSGTWVEIGAPPQTWSGICIYDQVSGSFDDPETWVSRSYRGIPAIGFLPPSGLTIAFSMRENDYNSSLVPAMLINPDDLSQQEPCDISPITSSNNILCCIMADWDPLLAGADRILANAENQCFAWYASGLADSPYPLAYGEEIEGSARPPFPALGELDNQDDFDYADYLVATREGTIMAYYDNGDPLSAIGFPYELPSQIYGGFAVADIDNDGYVEVVFGTMDNYLHVWELGECDEGYAPWPQCQHDAARTGVLLEAQE
jgi:hypothetical protein